MIEEYDLTVRLRAGTGGGKEWMELHEEAADALDAKDAEIARLRKALDWYADEARACAANSKAGKHTAAESLLASVTVLALDGGKRADAARGEAPPTKEKAPACSQDPDAPHGFNRDASHSHGRYVCDCEGFDAARGKT